MTIKGKPKNLDEFLGAGAEDKPSSGKSAEQQAARPATGRITKTIRISHEIEGALKDAAYERSKASGRRITESDLIDEALKQYLNTYLN